MGYRLIDENNRKPEPVPPSKSHHSSSVMFGFAAGFVTALVSLFVLSLNNMLSVILSIALILVFAANMIMIKRRED